MEGDNIDTNGLSYDGRFDDPNDFYAILGCNSKSSDKDIEKAYKKLALKYHPDKCKEGDTTAKEKVCYSVPYFHYWTNVLVSIT